MFSRKPSPSGETKNDTVRWILSLFFRPLTIKQKLIAVLIFVIIVVVSCISILTPILVLRQSNSSMSLVSSVETRLVSMCSRNTCVGTEGSMRLSANTVIYAVDGNYYDSTGSRGATPFGFPTLPYFSTLPVSGMAVYLTPSSSQYLSIPYVNPTGQSFTFQTWIVVLYDNSSSDYGVFGHCGSVDRICFSLSIRNNRVALSFDSNNVNGKLLLGSTLVPFYIWTHITVVYDANALQQLIYVNGRIDVVSQGLVYPYWGTRSSGTTSQIGFMSSVGYPASYVYGYVSNRIESSDSALLCLLAISINWSYSLEQLERRVKFSMMHH